MKWIALVTLLAALTASCGDDTGSRAAPVSQQSGGAGIAAAPAGDQSTGSQETTRKVIFTSSMRLEVPELRNAYLEIGQLTRSLGGFVADSSIDDSGGDGSTASIRLRVPASRHDELLAALRTFGGGRVLKESTTATEVTEEYTDVQSRLRNLERTEAQYQELLKQARTVDEILNVQSRLDSVRAQVEQAKGRMNLLDSQIDFATVSLALSLPGASAGEGIPGPGEVFGDAWDAGVIVARLLLNLAVVLAVAAIWLSIPALLLFAGIRWTARSRPGRSQPPPDSQE